uniref:Battenin n=1 Tax=Macrostomum lignano TaxID=282301 RepID=A0A1I8IZJ5_9PLAT
FLYFISLDPSDVGLPSPYEYSIEIRTDDEQPSKPPPSALQSSSKSVKGKTSPSGKLATISESESGDFEPDDEASLETGSSLDRLPLVDDEEAGGSGKGLNSKELQAIGFCGALKIPGVIEYSMCLFFAKLLFTYEKFGGTSLTHSIVLLFITGGFVNGPYALITTAVSADLGTACGSSARALATVTAIIDGAGSLGAAFGPLLTGLIVRTESVFNCRQLVSVTVYKMQCSGIRVVTVAALVTAVLLLSMARLSENCAMLSSLGVHCGWVPVSANSLISRSHRSGGNRVSMQATRLFGYGTGISGCRSGTSRTTVTSTLACGRNARPEMSKQRLASHRSAPAARDRAARRYARSAMSCSQVMSSGVEMLNGRLPTSRILGNCWLCQSADRSCSRRVNSPSVEKFTALVKCSWSEMISVTKRTSKSRSAARTQSCRFSRHGWNLLSSSTPTTRWAPSLNSSLVKPPGPQPISSTGLAALASLFNRRGSNKKFCDSCRRARRSSIRSRSARLGSGGRRIADFTVETDIAEIKEYSWPRLRTARACSVMFADKPEICDCNSSRQAFTLASGCGGRDCQHIGRRPSRFRHRLLRQRRRPPQWRTAGAGRWRTSELRAAEPDGPERRDDRGERSPARLGGLDSGAPLIPAPAAGRLERRRRYSRCLATEPARRPAGRLSRREPWKRYPGELGLRQIPLVAIGRPPARREVARVPRVCLATSSRPDSTSRWRPAAVSASLGIFDLGGRRTPSESASIAQRGLQLLLKLASARQSVQQLILGRSQIVSLTLAAGLACGQSRLKRLGVLPELSLGARQAVGATFGALQFSVQSAILGAPILRLGQLRFKPVGALLGRGRSDRQLGRFGVSASASFSQIFGCLGSADASPVAGRYLPISHSGLQLPPQLGHLLASFVRALCQLGFKRGAARLRLGQGGAQLAQLLGHCAGLGSVGSLPLSQLFGQRGFSRGTFGTQILVRFNELGVPDRCEA